MSTNPIQVLRDWFDRFDAPMQEEIAFILPMMLVDGEPSFDRDVSIANFREWLQANSSYRAVGKALSFAAVFEHFYGNRFHEAGWTRTRKMFESILKKEDTPPSVRATSERSLAEMPERIVTWKAIGEEWRALRAGPLSEKALEDFTMEEMQRRTPLSAG